MLASTVIVGSLQAAADHRAPPSDQRPAPAQHSAGRLMMHPHGLPHRKKRRVFPVGQQHPRPLDRARRFRSRAAIAPNATNSSSPMANSIACRHAAMSQPRFRIKAESLQAMSAKMNPRI